MKINKYWILDNDCRPRRIRTVFRATKEQFDSVCIIYYGAYFTPIVLHKDKVVSLSIWRGRRVKEFYRDLCTLLEIENYQSLRFRSFAAYRSDKRYEWGCRTFTKSQLLTIKKAMEEFYINGELK